MKPRIISFCCKYCGYAGADLAGVSRIEYPPNLSIVRVPCTGRVTPLHVIEAELKFREGEGFGVVEAPRETLLHRYSFSRDGVIKEADIITPTAFNSPAIEKDIEMNISSMHGAEIKQMKDRALNVLRDYDPCIPCATHMVEVVIDQ